MAHTVLLVEDDKGIATVITEALREEGFDVTACESIARRDALLGEPLGHLFTDEATGDARHLRKMSFNALMWRFFGRMLKDLVSGDRRRSALFDPASLEPIAAPHRLTEAEHRALGRL